jgi:hypothetical protein
VRIIAATIVATMSVRHGMCAGGVRVVDCVLCCVRVCASGVSNDVDAVLLLAVSTARVIVVDVQRSQKTHGYTARIITMWRIRGLLHNVCVPIKIRQMDT